MKAISFTLRSWSFFVHKLSFILLRAFVGGIIGALASLSLISFSRARPFLGSLLIGSTMLAFSLQGILSVVISGALTGVVAGSLAGIIFRPQ